MARPQKKGFADVLREPMQESEKEELLGKVIQSQKAEQERSDDPTKRMSQEEKIGRTSRKLEESDRRQLEQAVQMDQAALEASRDPNQQLRSANVDTTAIKTRMEKNKMILAHDDDLTPKSGTEKDRLYARLKSITETLQKNMPNKREMWPKTGSVEAQQAVRHNVKFQEQYGPLMHEYQELKKRLEPDDPYAQSLELIRPD